MSIEVVRTPDLSINTYIIIDDASRSAAVIDPARNVDPILERLRQKNADLQFILETHVHADFISGARELKQRLNNKPEIVCSFMGGDIWAPKYFDKAIRDRDAIELGSLKLEAWHTPGHTPEHLIYILISKQKPIAAFTGDFLFPGCVGRPDLLGPEESKNLAKKLYRSVFTVLPQLPDELPIFPAHGTGSLCAKAISKDENSTLKKEWKNNPYLQKQDLDVWIAHLLEGMPKAPAYFPFLKKINITGAPLLRSLAVPKKIDLRNLAGLDLANYYLLDIRNQEEFADRHLEGSVNIPWAQTFVRWAGEFIPYDQPIILIHNNINDAEKAIDGLHLIGLDDIAGLAVSDREFFEHYPGRLNSFPMLKGVDLLKQKAQLEIIDVRTDAEWNGGHIPGAKHFEVNGLNPFPKTLAKNKTIAFVCGTGYRAGIAASLAQKAGIDNVCNIKGGMQAWNQAELPLEK